MTRLKKNSNNCLIPKRRTRSQSHRAQLHAQQEERQLDREIARDAQAARQPAKVSPTSSRRSVKTITENTTRVVLRPGTAKSYVERVQEAKAKPLLR